MNRRARRVLLGVAIPVVAAALWVAAGRQCTLLADRLTVAPHEKLPIAPIRFDEKDCLMGEWSLTGMGEWSESRRVRRVGDEAIFYLGRVPFPLGLVSPAADGYLAITPPAADQIEFTVERSRLAWPTPFEFNFMTGHSPSWKRYLHYRLLWSKPDGSELRLYWRFEQWRYPAFGWTSGTMTAPEGTGLLEAEILPAAGDRPGS